MRGDVYRTSISLINSIAVAVLVILLRSLYVTSALVFLIYNIRLYVWSVKPLVPAVNNWTVIYFFCMVINRLIILIMYYWQMLVIWNEGGKSPQYTQNKCKRFNPVVCQWLTNCWWFSVIYGGFLNGKWNDIRVEYFAARILNVKL